MTQGNKEAAKPSPLKIGSIILADDDQDDHDFFRAALHEATPDVQVSIVEDGNALLSLLAHYLHDFIFLDLDMPCKNGLECLTAIRSNLATRHVPVVIFSSTSRPANIDAAYDMGADLFFVKPASFQELTNSLKAILQLGWHEPLKVKEQFKANERYTSFSLAAQEPLA